jgi:RNA polymerase sigma-70 factor, ECF subfamily
MEGKRIDAHELFILKKMIDGDINAFKHFFDTYYTDLCNFVNLYIKNQSISEEIVQDIFVHFWERKNILNIHSSVKSYLYSASKFRGLNHIRNTRRQQDILSKLDKEESTEISFNNLDESILRKLLAQAVDSLPNKCRQIFLMSQDVALTNQDIATNLGISIKTVENQMTIAYKKLRLFLQPYKEQIFILFVSSLLR